MVLAPRFRRYTVVGCLLTALPAIAGCRHRDAAPVLVDAAVPAAPPAVASRSAVGDELQALAAATDPEVRAGCLIELATLATTEGESAAISAAELRQLADGLAAALSTPDAQLQAAALSAIAALGALSAPARQPLLASAVPERLLGLLTGPSAPLLRGRGLFAVGTLVPGLASADQARATALLRAGLADADRFVWRQAVFGATLAQTDALDGDLLNTLRRLLGIAEVPGGRGALRAPRVLADAVVTELVPLLAVYVPLLLELGRENPALLETAEVLTKAVVSKAPRSATAHYFHAQALSARSPGDGKRPDPQALAEVRTALALGNLPAVFERSLSPDAELLRPATALSEQRAEVRRRLSARPAELLPRGPMLVTAARLDGEQPPRVRTVSPLRLEEQARALAVSDGAAGPAARQLGAALFAWYPFRSDEYYDDCLRSFLEPGGVNRDLVDRLGLSFERTPSGERELVGVVAVEAPGAGAGRGTRYGVTCALCHSQVDGEGRRVDGLPTRTYDQGLLLAACVDQPIHHKAQNRNLAELLEYLPGRNDSSSDGIHDPTEIPSLYGLGVRGPVRWNGDTATLEVQINRNLSQHDAPRPVIAVLAAYLRGLGAAVHAGAQPSGGAAWKQGRQLFGKSCARCHAPPLYTSGQLVPVEVLETDATRISAVLPNSSPGYKIPSLLRLERTAPYLHDGSVQTLEALLDARRAGGHRFGQSLSATERSALLSYLRTL